MVLVQKSPTTGALQIEFQRQKYFYLYLSPRLRHFTLDVSASLSSKHLILLNYHHHFQLPNFINSTKQ